MQYNISVTVNGTKHHLKVAGNTTLLNVLRECLGLTGTKEGCGSGDCGACTVILDGKAVKSCLYLAVDTDGKEVLTVEGLSRNGELDPLQIAFVEEGAVQCGYCTPGMLMSAKALLDRADGAGLGEEDVRHAIVGNLCRCTGYKRIVKAVLRVAQHREA